MAQFFSTIGRHLECAIQTELYHMPGRYERVRVGWHCAKVKGHAELKIEKSRVKTFIYDFPKLHRSSPIIGVGKSVCVCVGGGGGLPPPLL